MTLFKKEIRKYYLIWGAVIGAYLLFIFFFSYIRPYGMDEFRINYDGVKDIIRGFLSAYTTENTRIGVLINNILLYLGKWSFLALNPFVQILIVFEVYGLIFLRLPAFKTLKDLPTFAFILLASVFLCAQPDNSIFWMNGACSYSWLLPCFLLFAILFRLTAEKGLKLPNKAYLNLALFATGYIAGMSNENNAPMTLIFFLLFGAYCLYKKIKPPVWFWFSFVGVILGLIALFGAPGLHQRLQYWAFEDFRKASIFTKMFMHLSRMNDFIVLTLFIPLINIAGLILCVADKDKPAPIIKNKNFMYSLFFWGVSFTLAFVLFNAPAISLRVFYSASIFAVIAFIFFIEYILQVYRINLYKYILGATAAFVIIVLPAFTVPYINLYSQNQARLRDIKHAKERGASYIYAQKFTVLKGPTENLQIEYYDYLNAIAIKQAQIYYGIELKTTEQKTAADTATHNI